MSEDVNKAEAVAPGSDPTGETIDSGPIKVEVPIEAALDAEAEQVIATLNAEVESNPLADAIAGHFGVEPDALDSFVLTVQYRTDEGTSCSSAWSAISPAWVLRGLVAEAKRHTDGL